ncbi:MAG: metallophosphoesterase [Pseudomonadota bacterium]
MPAIFVHVSDIHFGQEKDDVVHIHSDVKEQLIADAASVVVGLPGSKATGILVTGDIAQAGKTEQYQLAGTWLDRLANAIGCDIVDVQMVPGNHDLDRDRTSQSLEHLLPKLREGGPAEYEKVLANDTDRAALFSRFADYINFSEGYNCPLNTLGKFSEKIVQLAPGRKIRFVRMNSALVCTDTDRHDKPELFIGARQFSNIPRVDGEENVLLIHHPLSWFKDAEVATTYIRSRTRVFIAGHEHNPKVTVERVEEGSDLMMLAAGATVPFRSNAVYTYTYNILVFDWDEEQDALSVNILPRAWNPTHTRFEADNVRLGGANPHYVLQSPNFRKCPKPVRPVSPEERPSTDGLIAEEAEQNASGNANLSIDPSAHVDMPQSEPDGYRQALLRFFRDLSEGERLRILIDLDAVPEDFDEPITHNIERELLDYLVNEGRLSEVSRKIDALVSARQIGEVDE